MDEINDSKKPDDLIEAIKHLIENNKDEATLKSFKEEGASAFHDTIGRHIRNSWKLWDKNSKLHKFFNSIGLYHPDDMSGVILETYHRIITGKPIELKEQIKNYEGSWKNINCDMSGNPLEDKYIKRKK